MPTTLVTLTGDVTDAIGTDFDTRRTKAYVRHNTPKIVTDDGPIHLGGGTVNVNSDGTFELPNVVAATSLVENLQATVYVDYEERTTRQRATATFGPYDLSAETGTVDISDLEAVQALDPSFASETMAAMQELLDEMGAISGLTGEDAAVALLIDTPSSDTAASLSASYGQAINVHADVTHGIGSGDDTAFLQAALDRVAPAVGLNTVVINGGTWMVDAINDAVSPIQNRWIGGGIKPKSGTTLVLADGATLQVISNGGPGYACIYLGSDQNNVTIRGGAILGDRATHDFSDTSGGATHEFGYGIAIRGATGFLVEGVNISGCTGDSVFVAPEGLIGVSTYYPAEGTIRRCTLDGARRNNISILGDMKVTVEDNWISDAGTNDGHHDGTAPRSGIDIEGYGVGEVDYEIPQNVTVRGNVIAGNVSASVTNFNGYGVVIDANFADSPINFAYGRDTIVRGNVLVNLSDTTNPAITSNGSGTYPAHSIIEGNIIRGFGTGIKVQRDNVLVSGNYIWGFDDFGIAVFGCTKVTLQGNQILEGSATAVGIQINTPTKVRVRDNEIENVATGITVLGSSTGIRLRNNSIAIASQGINITTACEVLVRGNTTDLPGHSSGQSYDVSWTSTAQVVCEDNTFRNSSTYSINATSGGSGGISRILRNKIVGNTSGAAISATSGAHEIIDNEIIFNRASAVTSAILLASASGSRIMGNTIYNVGAGAVTGIVSSSSGTTKIAHNTIQGGGTPITPAATDVLIGNVAVGDGVVAKSAAYTAKVTDRTILATGGAGGFTVTLPTAAIAGLRYEVKKVDAGVGAVTIGTTSSQTIDGSTTKVLSAQYDKASVVSDGTAWHLVG